MSKFLLSNLFSDFQSSEIESDELERIITDAVKKEYPDKSIEEFKYTNDGIIIFLNDGSTIEIEIDWQEIILI